MHNQIKNRNEKTVLEYKNNTKKIKQQLMQHSMMRERATQVKTKAEVRWRDKKNKEKV